jgi:hypothetical protein
MQLTPKALSFTQATAGVAQKVTVAGITSGNWSATGTAGVVITPLSGPNNGSFAVTVPSHASGPAPKPGATITVAAPGQPSETIQVALLA